jgi:hypothetical protein
MQDRDPITHLLSLGADPSDPLRQPAVNAEGAFLLEDEESVIHAGAHRVKVVRWNDVGGFLGNKQRFETVVRMEKKAEVHLTDQRLLYAWPKWKSDKATGSFLERRVMAPLLEKDEGKMILGGHLRHQWVGNVFAAKPKGLRAQSRVDIGAQVGETTFRILIEGFDDSSQEVARSFAAAVARRRLEQRKQIEQGDRAALEALASGDSQPTEFDWGYHYKIPAGLKLGYDFD